MSWDFRAESFGYTSGSDLEKRVVLGRPSQREPDADVRGDSQDHPAACWHVGAAPDLERHCLRCSRPPPQEVALHGALVEGSGLSVWGLVMMVWD